MEDDSLQCFRSKAPPVHLREDLEPLNGFQPNDLDDLATLVLEHLSSMDSKGLIAAVSNFAKSHGIKNMGVLESGVRGLLLLLQACGRENLTAIELAHDALRLGLTKAHAAALENSWRTFAAKSSAAQQLKEDVDVHIAKDDIDEETLRSLVDLEWRFGVTCISSHNSSEPIGKTFLQVKLVLDKNKDKTQLEYLELELTLPQFYDLLANLERAKAAVDQIMSVSSTSPP